jgi:hypothetical protein
MKRIISLIAVFAIALLLFAQGDTYAKTEKQAAKKLGLVNDEEIYNVQKPTVFKFKSKTSGDEAPAPRAGEKIAQEINLLFKRVNDYWHSVVLPVVYPKYKKHVYLEIAE